MHKCKVCGGKCHPGKALKNSLVGQPDMNESADNATLSESGPVELIDVLKCKQCGHSFTEGIIVISLSPLHAIALIRWHHSILEAMKHKPLTNHDELLFEEACAAFRQEVQGQNDLTDLARGGRQYIEHITKS